MNILIEGPYWMGQWSEIVDHSFKRGGHKTILHYHNVKSISCRLSRLSSNLLKTAGIGHGFDIREVSNKKLMSLAGDSIIDVLFSIQGKIDKHTVEQFRAKNPKLKVIFWFGDVLSDAAIRRINEVYDHVDMLLLSYQGDYDRFKKELGGKVRYFPFGVSGKFHTLDGVTDKDRRRLSADVSFVGTHYPERDVILTALSQGKSVPLDIWGRGWRRSASLRSKGRLTMQETLKVHLLSKVSLNIHHHLSNNGFNMKFYEIPAVGGFQICNWQPLLEEREFRGYVESYRDLEELADKIRYYLDHEDQRIEMANRFKAHVFENFCYEDRLNRLVR